MRKMPLEWHKQCLENWNKSLESDRQLIDRLLSTYKRNLANFQFYQEQIVYAESEGKDAFDSDKYKVKKRQEGL